MSEDRLPTAERAGTRLNHDGTVAVYADAQGKKQHGFIDRTQALYQGGGELGNFVLWRMKAVTIDMVVWRQIDAQCQRIEMIDHDKNECYSIDVETARASGQEYKDGKIGARYAIPLDLWEKSSEPREPVPVDGLPAEPEFDVDEPQDLEQLDVPTLPDRAKPELGRLELKERILMCEECSLSNEKVCTAPVPFSGPTPADWAILGEAPGRTEDRLGEPFIGQAGALMRGYMMEVGLDPEEAFIFNTVSCFPDRTPRPSEIIACRQNKIDQLDVSEARYVIVMGGVALEALRSDLKITKAHGRPFCQDYRVFLPTYHPAGALRKHEWEMDMQREIGVFAQMLKACAKDTEAWMEFILDTCVSCAKDIETMGQENKAVRYDPEGMTFCQDCWPASLYGRKEAA